jgi:asparagine synthase (glutamine-hydrolysing)
MCGISLVLDSRGASDVAATLAKLHAPIAHRGPDGERTLLLDDGGAARIGLAFRRLRILDLSEAAAQPMTDERGTSLLFNGEIYNYVALRSELEVRGHRFTTHGDSEVVLAAYAEWGSGCFARFEGMWAIVLVDTARRRVVVSRDRFGIKPLYWARVDGALLFASEVKQIIAAMPGRPRANAPLVRAYLESYRYPVTDETFFDGIRSVPPATFATIGFDEGGAPRFEEYWRLADFRANDSITYDDAVDRLDELLGAAVASHRVADVPVGALLSGGLDSSTIVSYIDDPLPTFSLSFRDHPAISEMPYVEAVLRGKRFTNHEATFDAAWFLRSADRVLSALEEPPLGMPVFGQYRVFELCRERGVTVVLDGQGADEIFAGYDYYLYALLKDRLLRRRLGGFAGELHAWAAWQERSTLGLFHELFVKPRLPRRRKAPAKTYVAQDVPRRMLDAEVAAADRDRGGDSSLVNRQLYFDVRRGNVQLVLGYGDRNAMAHSVESRVPYFDRAVVEHAFSLPDLFKAGRGQRKRVLRDVARRRGVPAMVTERRDRLGFGVPDETLLRGGLWEDVESVLHAPEFDAMPVVVADEARRYAKEFRDLCHHDRHAIWRLYMLGRWARLFDVTW